MLCCNDTLARFGHLTPFESEGWTPWALRRAYEMACAPGVPLDRFVYGYCFRVLFEYSDLLVDIDREMHPASGRTRHELAVLAGVRERVHGTSGAALCDAAELFWLDEHVDGTIDVTRMLVEIEIRNF